MSNIIYKIAKPFTLTIAATQHKYASEGMSNFSFLDFEEIYESIREDEGVRYLQEWERFKSDFEETVNPPRRTPGFLSSSEPTQLLWAELKAKHEEFLLNLLSIGFCNFNNQRSIALLICLIMSTLGYASLAYPSILVFGEIFQSTFL